MGKLVRLIRSNVPCECVYLHGSRAEGTEQLGRSDYDILAVASLPSLMSSIGRLPLLRRQMAKASSLPVDLTFITPWAASASRRSLLLISWSRKAKLVAGTRDVLGDLKISSMMPDPLSVYYNSGHQTKWLLRYISIDSNLRVSVERRGVKKLRAYLEEDIVLGAGSSKGLTDFASITRTEDEKENCDLHALSRGCAVFLKRMHQEILNYPPSPFFPSLLSSVSSVAEMRASRIPGFPPGRMTRAQLVNALMLFYQSMKSDPPNTDLVRRAALSLGSPLGLPGAAASYQSEDRYLLALWNRVRSKIRGNWDSIMCYPFGSLVFHRPFPIVLA